MSQLSYWGGCFSQLYMEKKFFTITSTGKQVVYLNLIRLDFKLKIKKKTRKQIHIQKKDRVKK